MRQLNRAIAQKNGSDAKLEKLSNATSIALNTGS